MKIVNNKKYEEWWKGLEKGLSENVCNKYNEQLHFKYTKKTWSALNEVLGAKVLEQVMNGIKKEFNG